MVVIVLSKASAMWREESTKTLLHDTQLKYVDVGETRVLTNSRCTAEQIKNDRVKRVVMDGPKIVEDDVVDGQGTGRCGKGMEAVTMDGPKVETSGQVVGDAEMDGREIVSFEKKSVQKNILTKIATDGFRIEEVLCTSIMKGLARRNREMHAMLADVDEENHDVVCVDGTTGKEFAMACCAQKLVNKN